MVNSPDSCSYIIIYCLFSHTYMIQAEFVDANFLWPEILPLVTLTSKVCDTSHGKMFSWKIGSEHYIVCQYTQTQTNFQFSKSTYKALVYRRHLYKVPHHGIEPKSTWSRSKLFGHTAMPLLCCLQVKRFNFFLSSVNCAFFFFLEIGHLVHYEPNKFISAAGLLLSGSDVSVYTNKSIIDLCSLQVLALSDSLGI